jgi:hypothetical protein
MKKEALRFFAMVILLVMVAFVSALASASAQTPSSNLSADIPFEFNVGDTTLPSGTYLISQINGDGSALRVRNSDDNQNAIRLTNPVTTAQPKEISTLVFERYGDRYFLSQIWIVGELQGRQMVKSSQQRAADRELARRDQKAENVTIAAVMH